MVTGSVVARGLLDRATCDPLRVEVASVRAVRSWVKMAAVVHAGRWRHRQHWSSDGGNGRFSDGKIKAAPPGGCQMVVCTSEYSEAGGPAMEALGVMLEVSPRQAVDPAR